MTVSDFTMCESKVREAAATGTLVDLRVGDSAIDSPEKGTEWGTERTVRAEVIADLLIGTGEAAAVPVRGVRVQGARITGELNLEATTLRCPLALLDCSFASAINLNEAAAVSVRLSGSYIPSVRAKQLQTRGDLRLDKGLSVSEGVELAGAYIRGDLACTGSHFSNPSGDALSADGITVDGDMFCNKGFSANGGVFLDGAHIGGGFFCTGGQFSNPDGVALGADGITVDGDMFCNKGFSANGEVRLPGAHIGGGFLCIDGHFSKPGDVALNAPDLSVRRDMLCNSRFSASGEVRLFGAHIGGALDCNGSHFSNPGGFAINLWRATVSGPLHMESAVVEGILNLNAAKTSSYRDKRAFWPEKLRLTGFVYDSIEGASAKQRLQWLRRNERGYSPQIYDQLAAVYRRAGHDEDARRVLIEKQRRRFAQRKLAWRVGGYILDGLVGYGYRTWLAFAWVAGLLIVGTILFNSLYTAHDLTAASKTTPPPPFNPFLYTLDLLLPVASLHQRDGWVAQGAAQWCSVIFIVMGWILASAIVLSLTGLLKRD